MLSEAFQKHLSKKISDLDNGSGKIQSNKPIGGGSINDSFRISTDDSSYFLKVNSTSKYPGMFEVEAKGLNILSEVNALNLPQVYLTGNFKDDAFLLMEFMQTGIPIHGFWENFARGMAAIHQTTNDHFGLDHDNYIGSLPQSNKESDTWHEFFIDSRLEPMIKRAKDQGRWNSSLDRPIKNLFTELPSIFPEEPPSLLHGDLWSGNYLCNYDGAAVIFDPAVYFGHREMDIGMSKLFGGFSTHFYQYYNDAYPMENGWQDRIDIANLYPLMVHVVLFGGSYINSVKSILTPFN